MKKRMIAALLVAAMSLSLLTGCHNSSENTAAVDVQETNYSAEEVVKNLFDNVAAQYSTREGGYTRMYKKGPRRGDGAEIVILELV